MARACRIELLGGLRVAAGDRIITRFRTRKSAELLAYLACHLSRAHGREHLVDLLWPEADLDAGRHNLSMALSMLRPLLEPPGAIADGSVLVTDRDTVALSPATVTTDVVEFESCVARAKGSADEPERLASLVAAADLYRGLLLPGSYEDWVLPHQRRLAEMFLQSLHHLVGDLERRGDLEQALRYGLRAVEEDPLREEAHREVIRLYLATGRLEAARRQYDELAHRLKAELDVRPSAETQDLLVRAGVPIAQAPVPAVRRRTAVAAERLAIAVAERPAQVHFAAPSVREPVAEAERVPRLERVPNNLPCPVTSFIGRDKEMADARRLLSTARLLTLTGAGGCGKSRLAIEVGEALLEQFPDGVWLVELGSLSDPSLVANEVAAALKVRRQPHRPAARALVEHLRPKTLLLVLDNCEHLLDACSELVGLLLRSCPGLRILATSREGLGVPGDVCYYVPSLSVPRADDGAPADLLDRYEAVRLFADRATAALPTFSLTARNAPAVAQICRRLDGIPLAIELAAAHVRALSADQIARRLDDRFSLLTGGTPVDLPRHRTLRSLFDWSWELLSEHERVLLRRLSVFAGGCTLEAAEEVCGGDDLGSDRVAALLSRLVARSLVALAEPTEEPRYRLLETTRAYAVERLLPGEGDAAARRHAAYYLRVAEEADSHSGEAVLGAWYERLEAEHDNLRAALDWCGASRDAETGLALATMLCRFWYKRGYVREGCQHMERMLAVRGAASPATQARALNGAGSLAVCQGDFAAARALHEESLQLYRQIGNEFGTAVLLSDLGLVAQQQGDSAAARANYEESLATMRRLGNDWGVAYALNLLGAVAAGQGDLTGAQRCHEEGLRIARQRQMTDMAVYCADGLATLHYRRGEYVEARRLGQETLALRRDMGDTEGIAESLEMLAAIAAGQQDAARAARLLGAAQALRRSLDLPRPLGPPDDAQHALNAARAALGDGAFAITLQEGRSMTVERAIEYALAS